MTRLARRASAWWPALPIVFSVLVGGCGDPGGEPTESIETGTAIAPVLEDLAGGGRLVVVQDPAAARVDGVVRFAAGSIHDPAGKTGLTQVLADALHFGGPMQRSGRELHDRLRERDAALQVSSGTEYLSFSFSCPPDALPMTLAAIGDLVLHPHYPPEFVDRARERLLERLAAEAVDPAALADQQLLDTAYGPDAPYTRAPTFASVEAVERDDLLAFHRAHLGTERLEVGMTGPLSGAAARDAVAAAVAEFATVGEAAVVTQPPFRALEQAHLVVVDVPGAQRTELRIGMPGVSLNDPDYAALRLWSDVHGTAADSPLELASDSIATGLVERMGAFFRPRWRDPGEFLAYATTAADDPHRALGRLAMWIADATLEGEVEVLLADHVLAASRQRVIEAELLASHDKPWLERVLDLDAHDRPSDFWARNLVEVREVGAARLRAAADRHAQRQPWLIVVARPSEIDPAFPHRGTAEARSAGFAPRGTPEGLVMLERVFAALGGIERWAALDCLYLAGDVRTNSSEEPVRVRVWRNLASGRLRLEQRVEGTTAIRIASPDGAWTATDAGLEPLPPEVRFSVRFREARQLPSVLHELATSRALSVHRNADQLEIHRWGRLLCWMRLGSDGRPTVLGYPGTETERQGESEFRGWITTGDGLVLPDEIAEPTLGRSFSWSEVTTGEPCADEQFRR